MRAGLDAVPEQARVLVAPHGVSIALDGQMGDWASVPGVQVPLSAIPEEFREQATAAADVTATLKVATDGANIYVLVAVPDGFNYDPADHRLSPALGVEWPITAGATPQMGATGADLTASSGTVDIWHWELDCPPGQLSGGSFPSGNDPACNLDDEYATETEEREDDDADNSLTGSWDHTARAQGIDAAGVFVFEIARPLQTGDPQDVQFTLGGTTQVALAYWDGNEGNAEKGGGWSDAGHAVSITADEGLNGWINVTLASSAAAQPVPAAPDTGSGGIAEGDGGVAPTVMVALVALAAVTLGAARVATGLGAARPRVRD